MLSVLSICSLFVFADGDSFVPSSYDARLRRIKLPVVEIYTVNGLDPSGTHMEAPEGLWGVGMRDNEYLEGRMRVTLCDSLLYDSGDGGMKIRLRGNTSSYYRGKKPYKIKLSKKFDFLFRNDSRYADKEWVLLRIHEGLSKRFLTGYFTGMFLDLGWQPKWQYVNLVLNGDYKGDYILIESIKKSKSRIDIEDTGYLIEDDAYWWNEDLYFKGNTLIYKTGYTFKYPDADDVNDSIMSNIRNYILDFEKVLVDGGEISGYIDVDRFVAWLMAQDILGQSDSAGTNRYLFKKNFDPSDPTSSPLQMGPLWDFDGALNTEGMWSAIHKRSYGFYFDLLLDRQDFYSSYVDLWRNIRKDLYENIVDSVVRVNNEMGEAIDASRKLDNERWPSSTPYQSLADDISEIDEWLETRIKWIDEQLLTRYRVQFVVDGEIYSTDSLIYRDSISYPPLPEKVGYTFSGWDTIPDIMPASDLTIRASFMAPTIYDVAGRRHYDPQKLQRGVYIIDRKKKVVR